jgi:hypothetical protein
MSKRRPPDFPFVAPKPALSGEPGERIAECVGVETKVRGNKCQVWLTFETEDGETARMWVEVPERLTPTCRYMRLVRLALGRETRQGEPIHPRNVFEGRRFRIVVGWRKSRDARGKGGFDEALAESGPKDPSDFLRIHELAERLDPCP